MLGHVYSSIFLILYIKKIKNTLSAPTDKALKVLLYYPKHSLMLLLAIYNVLVRLWELNARCFSQRRKRHEKKYE